MAERFLGDLSLQLHAVNLPDPVPTPSSPRLIPYRNDFRKLISHQEAIPVMQRYLSDNEPLVRSIAIWLLSKHANRILLLGLDQRCYDPSPMVRKHLAKALHRLEAWQALENMAAEHPEDVKVAWFVRRTPNQKSYHDRLEHFTSKVDQTHRAAAIGPSRMPLWLRDEYWGGTPPKSIEYIRQMLLRIRSIVDG